MVMVSNKKIRDPIIGLHTWSGELGMGGVRLMGGIRLLVAQAVGMQHGDHALRVQDHPLRHRVQKRALWASCQAFRGICST